MSTARVFESIFFRYKDQLSLVHPQTKKLYACWIETDNQWVDVVALNNTKESVTGILDSYTSVPEMPISSKDDSIDDLKRELAEKDLEIARLKQEIDSLSGRAMGMYFCHRCHRSIRFQVWNS